MLLREFPGAKGSAVHKGVDTLGHLLALHAAPADERDRAQVGELARQVQQITEENVEPAYGEASAWAARFRRVARDYERVATTLGDFHFSAFACFMIANLFRLLT